MKIKIAFIRKHLRIFFTVVTLTSLFVFVSCDDDDDNKVPQPTANILEVNIQGSNGVIHVIDKVLIPAFEE